MNYHQVALYIPSPLKLVFWRKWVLLWQVGTHLFVILNLVYMFSFSFNYLDHMYLYIFINGRNFIINIPCSWKVKYLLLESKDYLERILFYFLWFLLSFCFFFWVLTVARNRSLTKEDISAFWRLKKIEEEELFFLKASYRLSKEDNKVCIKTFIFLKNNQHNN